jgi:predicted transcriptional regulator
MRTIVDIPNDSLQKLDHWATACKVSRAEAVRRAISDFIERTALPKDAGFGLWTKNQQGGYKLPPERDGLLMQLSLREEWPE